MVQSDSSEQNQTWSSGFTFILAAVGAAVGLGNIWKFPYVVGVSGGGAFILVYLACVVFVAIPILIAELWLGRRGHHSPPVAMAAVAKRAGRSRAWSDLRPLGAIGLFADMTIFALIDYVTANLLMPLGGILIAVFVGWRIAPALLAEELSFGNKTLFSVWLWMIRVVAPLAILAVLYTSL